MHDNAIVARISRGAPVKRTPKRMKGKAPKPKHGYPKHKGPGKGDLSYAAVGAKVKGSRIGRYYGG